MQDYVSSLRSAIARGTPALLAMSDSQSLARPGDGKWSPREVIGHLVDSASNNHQRFVRARFQDDLIFTGYEQDAWVAAQQYQDAPWAELVSLWGFFNLHLARVMETTPESARLRVHHRHNLDALAWRPVPGEVRRRSTTSWTTTSVTCSTICGRSSETTGSTGRSAGGRARRARLASIAVPAYCPPSRSWQCRRNGVVPAITIVVHVINDRSADKGRLLCRNCPPEGGHYTDENRVAMVRPLCFAIGI